jgi:hypothetical protein
MMYIPNRVWSSRYRFDTTSLDFRPGSFDGEIRGTLRGNVFVWCQGLGGWVYVP